MRGRTGIEDHYMTSCSDYSGDTILYRTDRTGRVIARGKWRGPVGHEGIVMAYLKQCAIKPPYRF
jgi:hypothetical protein